MDKKFMTLLTVVFIGLLLLTGVVITAADDKSTDVPDEVIIENEGYQKDKKGPVKLEHKRHTVEYKVACIECHHKYKDGKNIWKEGDPVEKCSECHNPLKQKGEEVRNLKKAYHNNCQGCHKTLAKKGKVTEERLKELRKCGTCHQKKS